MDKLLLIAAAVSYATTVIVSARECYTDSTCISKSDTHYCDMVVNKCTSCDVPCGADGVTATCHRGCSRFCERLRTSGTKYRLFPKCWEKLPSATPPIYTQKPWQTASLRGCLDNPSVCKLSQFCSETSNSCKTCAKPCGQRGNYKSCQKRCPKWCEHVLSRRRMVKYPLCRPITTAAPKPSASPTSKPSTEEPTVPAYSQTNSNGKITNIPPSLSNDNSKPRTTGRPKNQQQEDSGPMKVYTLSAVCGLVFIVCIIQYVVIVRRHKASQKGCNMVQPDVVNEDTGGIPRQDMGDTSGAVADTQAESTLKLL